MATSKIISPIASLRKIYTILHLDRKDISSIYMFAILAGILQLSLPLGIQTIIGFVLAGSISTSIIVLIVLVVFGTFLTGLLQVKQLGLIEKLKQKIFLRHGLEFSDRLPKIDIEKLGNNNLPELVNRFFDTISLQKGLEKLLLDIPASIIQIVFGLLLLSFYHPVFIGFGLVLLTIVIIMIRATSTAGLKAAMQSSDEKYHIVAWLQEMARMVSSFKYTKGRYHMYRTDILITKHLEARTGYFKILLVQFWSLISFKIVITAAMLIVGAVLLVNQQINIGQFIAADIVIITIIGSIEKLIASLDKIYDAMVSVEKLATVTEAVKESSGMLLLTAAPRGVSISFNDVGYAYDEAGHILKNVNFIAKPGQWVQITGKSGSGKSTVLRLLTGSLKNFEGHILIDEQPIDSYDVSSLRNLTGVLLNAQHIFEGTLLDNITMGHSNVALDEVMEYADAIGLSNFIHLQKTGITSHLNAMGATLPKHIRKKILLVRALIGHNRLLLLEDPFEGLLPAEIHSLIHCIKTKQHATVIFVSENAKLYDGYDVFLSL